MTQNRLFPRIVKELEVSYEFVSWKETSLKKLSSGWSMVPRWTRVR